MKKLVLSKRILLIICILILAIGGRFLLLREPSSDVLYTVKKDTIVDTVQVTGTYKVGSQVEITSPTTGIISEIYINNNMQVKKGDRLLRVISTATEEEIAGAWASYQTSLNSLKTAQQNKTTAQAALEQARKSILDSSQAVTYMEDRVNTSQNNPSTGKQYSQNEVDAIRSSLTSSRQSFSAAEQKYRDADYAISAAQAQVKQSKLAYDCPVPVSLNSQIR